MHNATVAPLGPLDFRPLAYAVVERLTDKAFSRDCRNSLMGYAMRIALMNLDGEPANLGTLPNRSEVTPEDVAPFVALLREIEILAPVAVGDSDSYAISPIILETARAMAGGASLRKRPRGIERQ